MSRASVLARGRAAAQAGMVDACIIERQTGSPTNATTGVVTPTWSTVYTGPCRVQERGGYPRDVTTAPDQPQLALPRELQLPVDTSTAVLAGDRCTITAAANDAGLVGTKMWLRGRPAKTEATARRFMLEEVAG